MNAIPLLRAKAGTYEGRTVYTADGIEPVAWQCKVCGIAYGVLGITTSAAETALYVAEACCRNARCQIVLVEDELLATDDPDRCHEWDEGVDHEDHMCHLRAGHDAPHRRRP